MHNQKKNKLLLEI